MSSLKVIFCVKKDPPRDLGSFSPIRLRSFKACAANVTGNDKLPIVYKRRLFTGVSWLKTETKHSSNYTVISGAVNQVQSGVIVDA